MFKITVVALWLCLLALCLFFPFALIWALNTLFSLGIPYTIWTYLSVVVINIWTFSSNLKIKS